MHAHVNTSPSTLSIYHVTYNKDPKMEAHRGWLMGDTQNMH